LNTDRIPSPTNDETSPNNTEQAKKLYLLGNDDKLKKDILLIPDFFLEE
jgi:hypothetical protein